MVSFPRSFLLLAALAMAAAADWKDEILQLQQEVLTAPEIGTLLDEAVQTEVEQLKLKFLETPRPYDRPLVRDTPRMKQGTALWFLLELPQWWVTATFVERNSADEMTVLLTSDGNRHLVNVAQIRAVREEDELSWSSEFTRDLGELARLQDDQVLRKAHYQRSIELDPTNPHPMDNFGLYYMEELSQQGSSSIQKFVDKSRKWFEKSLQAKPLWYHSYYNLGLLLRDHYRGAVTTIATRQQREWTALELFERAFELNPMSLDSLWNVADQHSQQGRYAEECRSWRILRVLNRNPSPWPDQTFHVWDPVWEETTTHRIEQCMLAMKLQRQRHANSTRGADEL